MRLVHRLQNMAPQDHPFAVKGISFPEQFLEGGTWSELLLEWRERETGATGQVHAGQQHREEQKQVAAPARVVLEGPTGPNAVKTMCQLQCQNGAPGISLLFGARA